MSQALAPQPAEAETRGGNSGRSCTVAPAASGPCEGRDAAVSVSDSAPASEVPDFLLWQLIDSAFPTGGFAHSGGIEAAWQHGELPNRGQLGAFLESALSQAGRGTLPFVRAAHAEPDRLPDLDRYCDAFTSNHVANRASRRQGRAFLSAAQGIFAAGDPAAKAPGRSCPSSGAATGEPAIARDMSHARHPAAFAGTGAGPTPLARYLAAAAPPCGHLAPVFGAVARWLQLEVETAVAAFLFQHLRGLLAAAVRLNIVGPMEAQGMQFRLNGRLDVIRRHSVAWTLDDLTQTSPLLEIWQGAHDRLYSRLFQS